MQQPQVEIAAVHDQVFLRQNLPERIQLEARGEHIDEEHFAADQKLQQANPCLVVKHVVRLGIEGDLFHPFERGEQR